MSQTRPGIAVLDYRMGNLRSVQKALQLVGGDAWIATTPAEMAGADGLVLPGVGAFGDAMANLREIGFASAVRAAVTGGTPLLGICVGLQVLFERSTEMGSHEGLGLLGGRVERFPNGLVVPHVGWNQLHKRRPHFLLDAVDDDSHAYFTHSYYAVPSDESAVVATTDYGLHFASVVAKGNICGVPYGYVMSVWGSVHTPWKVKKWGAPEIPCVFVEHYRADPVIDLRPISSRGSQYWATECAMGGTRGIGPLGMDFWNLTPEEGGWKGGGARCLEGSVCNLSMSAFTTAAYLAPGPDGPISTARFEIFRQGLQTCEARTVIQRALEEPEKRGRLGEALAKKCEDVVKRRGDNLGQYAARGERYAQGEGWKWFETCDWQERDGELFDCAEEVVKIVGGK